MDKLDLHSVLDAVLGGVILVDRDGRIEHVNAEACRILEMSAEKVVGTKFADLFGSEDPVHVLAEQVLRDQRASIADDVAIERRFERDVLVDVAVSPIGPGGDENKGLVIELRDHTLSSSLRERHAHRDELQRFGHIATGIAHEIRNPLGGIRGAAELVRSWTEEERAHTASDVIVREVDRISELLDQLMVFARDDELKLAPVNVHRVLDDVLALLEMDSLSKDVSVERIYDPSIPELQADTDRLTQVFLNLARNALQAMEESGGGTISVTTRMALEDRVTREDGRQVPTVLITVSDTGVGIPPNTLARLATPFFTTRSGGTGLGLAVSRQWVTRHDGTLHITSQVGEGTTARVALPLAGPQSADDAPQRNF